MATSPVVVLGMHRCGTSLTARILNLLGLDLGKEEGFLEPAEDNPLGFWEQAELTAVSDAVLEVFGGKWWRPPELPTGWERQADVAALAERARDALQQAGFRESRPWGWKDPRLSLTLPFWLDLISEPHCVICLRSPGEVVSSLLEREPATHTPHRAAALWLTYVIKALESTQDLARTLVFYDDLIERPTEVATRLAAFVGRESAVEAETLGRIEKFTDSGMRHQSESALELARNEDIPAVTKGLYLSLRASSALGDSEASRELSAAIEQVARPLAEPVIRVERRLAATVEKRMEALEASRIKAGERRDAIRRELKNARSREKRLRSNLERAGGRANELEADLRSVRGRYAAVVGELNRVRSQAAEAQTAANDAQLENESLQSQLEAQGARAGELEREGEDLRETIDALDRKLVSLHNELEATAAELGAQREQHQLVLQSRAWRMSEPVRRLRARIRSAPPQSG